MSSTKRVRSVVGLGTAALLATGCPDDVVDNPFNATEGMTGTGTADDDGVDDGKDDGQDDGPIDSTGTTGDGTTGDGTTMMVVDEDSTTGEPPDTTGDESSSTGEPPPPPPPPEYEPCPAGVLPNAPLPQTVNGNSSGEDSEFGSTCGGGGAPDLAWLFTAPFDGDFTFDTQGSSFDTVLSVRDGNCTGPQLQCDDDGIVASTQSMLSVPLLEGQEVTVVVDAFGLSGGNVQLSVREGTVSCPTDIGSTVPQTVNGQTLVATNEFEPSCFGGGNSADQGYLFTPPQDGVYTFEITNNTFDTVLTVLNGECAGPELACNDNLTGSLSGASGFAVPLTGGNPVTVVVDGAWQVSGTFDLNIGMLEGDCPDGSLGNMAPPFSVNGNTNGQDNASAGSCGGLASPDYSYTWTAPFEATFRFTTEGSGYDTVVYVLDGNCLGPELGCGNDNPLGTWGTTFAHLTAGQQVVVVVDGNGAQGPFTLAVEVDCPAADLGSTVPQTVSGQNFIATDAFMPSCSAFGGGPDQGYTFTAPVAGTYTFETTNNTFNTILSVLNGTCAGAELACNDDLLGANNGASGLTVNLAANQAVTAVVDGNWGETGSFDLVIGLLQGTCPDENLGNLAVPFTVMGATAGQDNAVAGSCGGLGSNDYAYTWTAPAAATYLFNTAGSNFDTVVYVIDGANCTGAQLACNNNTAQSPQGAAIATLAAGQTVTIVVDGNGAQGNFTLTVEETVSSGDCCDAHPYTGCQDPAVEACVCAMDGFCCSTSWDGWCATEAVDFCGAVCP